MRTRHSLPDVWLISDARNDTALESTLRRMPRGSGLIFRHYHLEPAARRKRFERLVRLARGRGHWTALAGPARLAKRWGADAAYGPARMLAGGPGIMRLVTAHSLREIRQAQAARADAILLSPVFPTRSHSSGGTLGPVRFRLLARQARVPVIALGGMDRRHALAMGWCKWAAIDGLSGVGCPPQVD